MYLNEYFSEWVDLNKKGVIAEVTLQKYQGYMKFLNKYANDYLVKTLKKTDIQKIINKYGEFYCEHTTKSFFYALKSCLLDAYEEGDLKRVPPRKVAFKCIDVTQRNSKKFLNLGELQILMKSLNLNQKPSIDYLIFLLAKTGLRIAEALAITPNDFDFQKQELTINKTLDYKIHYGEFKPTKNKGSNRTIILDWQTIMEFSAVVKNLPENKPIFTSAVLRENEIRCERENGERVHISTIAKYLRRRCEMLNIPVITPHSLRHTHASMLLANGVSVASIAKRLGHSSAEITQRVYLHLLKEMEAQDTNLMLRSMVF